MHHFNSPLIEQQVQVIYAIVIFTIPLLVAIATATITAWFKVRQAYQEACRAHGVSLDNGEAIKQIKSQLNGSTLAYSHKRTTDPETSV